MPKPGGKVRTKFDTSPLLRRALELRALLDDCDLQDVVNAALQVYLVEQIDEVVRRGMVRRDDPPADDPPPGGGTTPASRKRKGKPPT